MSYKQNIIKRDRVDGIKDTYDRMSKEKRNLRKDEPFVLMFRNFIFFDVKSYECRNGDLYIRNVVDGIVLKRYFRMDGDDQLTVFKNRTEFDSFMKKVEEEGYWLGPDKHMSFEKRRDWREEYIARKGEREHYKEDGVSHDEIIANWSIYDNALSKCRVIKSKVTGQLVFESIEPELVHKVYSVLQGNKQEDSEPGIHGLLKQAFESQMKSISKIVREGTTGRENVKADMEHDAEVISRAVRDSKDKPLLTDPKGLGNGYFIRQHTNPEDSSRYTLAFNPEGTVKTQLGDDLPYVIECFGNNYHGMTRWAIHVFNTRQDMVAALNYDLKVRDRYSSKNFGDSIGELNITKDVFKPENTTPVFDAWMDNFGEPFIKNMTSRDIFIDGYFRVKTFSTVFISEKTGALVVKGLIRERYSYRNHNFVWFIREKVWGY